MNLTDEIIANTTIADLVSPASPLWIEEADLRLIIVLREECNEHLRHRLRLIKRG